MKQALVNTAKKRKTLWIVEEFEKYFHSISESSDLENRWKKYSKTYDYAKNITYRDVIHILESIMDEVFEI